MIGATCETYPAERKQQAYVAANDRREGVGAFVAHVGEVDSRVLPAGAGRLLVQVSQIAASRTAPV